MNKQDEKFVAHVRRELCCKLDDCVSNITFTVTEFEHLKDESRVRAYSGQCKKCHNAIKLTKASFSKFERLFGSPALVITKVDFDALFDTE